MSSGWVGPGAKDSPTNKFENDNYARIKAQVEAEEKEKRDTENARRVELGQKPCESKPRATSGAVIGQDADISRVTVKDSYWTKTKRGLAKALKM